MVYYPGYLLWVYWDGKSLVPCLGSRVCACWYLYSTVEDCESAGNVVWPVDTTTQMNYNYMNSDGWFIEVLFCHFHELYCICFLRFFFFRILCYSDSIVTIANLVFAFWFQWFRWNIFSDLRSPRCIPIRADAWTQFTGTLRRLYPLGSMYHMFIQINHRNQTKRT